ncbi:hypothetical protein M407DRAFT_223533 [Tulasnella calospora MUT 4182]|uniref:Small nuclear ribonucleoprotein Prp3 C-terminal domain-containing protein n=1 Tax=Tulasnella calospora MUT 4182 TaxID=1051891 RepID=A0A0C3Q6Z6_9AGAM|nr:hypothetical protein M407DRAFT_223533 [Tulasnella calospora MUT 4182]
MTLATQLEEILLIKFSLLPGESLVFEDDEKVDNSESPSPRGLNYSKILEVLSQTGAIPESGLGIPQTPLTFTVTAHSISITVTLGETYPETPDDWRVSVHGETISRQRQELWDKRLKERMKDLIKAEETSANAIPSNIAYQLFSDYALPSISEEASQAEPQVEDLDTSALREPDVLLCVPFHAMLSSHHLISPQKRKSLLKWSQELNLNGFAKVGYPGIIYAEGTKGEVEEFVQRIKQMQWLALRVRYVEPVPDMKTGSSQQGWKEVTKVGEAIEEMKRKGREKLIVSLGFGAGE